MMSFIAAAADDKKFTDLQNLYDQQTKQNAELSIQITNLKLSIDQLKVAKEEKKEIELEVESLKNEVI